MSDQNVIAIEPHEQVVLTIVQHERLDEELTEQLLVEVQAAGEQARERPVVLDLSKVEFFPSLSLGALVRIHGELKQHNQRFMLVAAQPPSRDALAITHLDKLFEVYEGLDDALKQLRLGESTL